MTEKSNQMLQPSLKKGKTASEGDLINFCEQHLADFKCPTTFHFVEDIPKGATGKLLKRELKDKSYD